MSIVKNRKITWGFFFVALIMCLFTAGSLNATQGSSTSPPQETTAGQEHTTDERQVEPTQAEAGEASPVNESHGSSDGHDDHGGGHSITHAMMLLVLQLGFIIIVAKFFAEFFERVLKQPAVLGELAAGMVIGPYALGPFISIMGSGPLFPLDPTQTLPVSVSLYGVATVASIILLFMVGLETDFKQFMRYAAPGAAVGLGGVLGSFVTGDLLYSWYTGESFMSPAALFMGTVSTATSVGITARVLSEKKKLDSPEGTTILAGAVIDDVLGILILAVVIGIAAVSSTGGTVDWGHIGLIAAKAFGFWLIATALGIAMSSRIQRFLRWFKSSGSVVSLGFGLALLLAGVAETFGLAMIIGAYIMGLSLSKEEVAHYLERRLVPMYACFVPVFFAVMGMLVNFEAMMGAIGFGIVYTIVAIISKTVVGGLPALFVGFNMLGACRIGLGMLPRGEVALIVAGVGISQGFLGQDMFGVVIMMTLITTIVAPPGLVWLFSINKPGTKPTPDEVTRPGESEAVEQEKMLYIDALSWTNHGMLLYCVENAFKSRGFSMSTRNADDGIYQFTGEVEGRKINVILKDLLHRMEFKTQIHCHEDVKNIVSAALLEGRERVTNLEIKEVDLTKTS